MEKWRVKSSQIYELHPSIFKKHCIEVTSIDPSENISAGSHLGLGDGFVLIRWQAIDENTDDLFLSQQGTFSFTQNQIS